MSGDGLERCSNRAPSSEDHLRLVRLFRHLILRVDDEEVVLRRGRTIADGAGHAVQLDRGRVESVDTARTNPADDLADARRVGIARRPLRQDGVQRRDVRAGVAVVAGRPREQDVVAVARNRIDATPADQDVVPSPRVGQRGFPRNSGDSVRVRRGKVLDLQWVQIPPGNWVAPAGSYRSDAGRKRNRRSLRDRWVALATQRADRP